MSNSRKPSFQTNSTKSFQERSPKRAFNDKERRFDERRNNENVREIARTLIKNGMIVNLLVASNSKK